MHSFCFSFLIWGFPASPLGFFISVRLLRNFIKVIDRLRISSHDADYKSMNRNSFSSKCGASPPPDLLLTSCGKLPIVLLLQRGVRRVLFLQRVVRHWRRKRVSGLDQSGTWRPRRGLRGADSGRRRGQPLERGGCSSAHLLICSSAHLLICSSGQEMDAATFCLLKYTKPLRKQLFCTVASVMDQLHIAVI